MDSVSGAYFSALVIQGGIGNISFIGFRETAIAAIASDFDRLCRV
jgi:hypothetical protein